MPVTPIHDRENYSLVLSLRTSRFFGDPVVDLSEALAKLEDSLSDKGLYFRAIDVTGKWRPGRGGFNPFDAFDPYNDDAIGAWSKIGSRRENLPGLRKWLADVEALLTRYVAEEHQSICETDMVVLAEVPLGVFAIMHLEFVPIYARFIDLWINADARQQNSIVSDIMETHGPRPEVEDLLFKLVVEHGGDGDLIEYALRPELEKHYGDFTESPLFRRMIVAMHAKGAAMQDSTGKRYIFSYTPSWPELSDAAKAILAELDAA